MSYHNSRTTVAQHRRDAQHFATVEQHSKLEVSQTVRKKTKTKTKTDTHTNYNILRKHTNLKSSNKPTTHQ